MPEVLALAPFHGLRLSPDVVGNVAAALAPPYDVIDDALRAELLARSPYNVVRLTLPGGGEERYAAAAAALSDWRRDGVLVSDATAALYVYEQTEAAGHVQRGLVGALVLMAPEAGVVLPHENTMAGPVADRLALALATAADLEPIFLLYDGGGAATAATLAATAQPPLLDTLTDDGTRHRLWAITDPVVLAAIAGDLATRRAVIADGHHRFATYLQRQAQRRAADGPGPWDYGLTFLVDASAGGPRVAPIHRVLHGLDFDTAVTRARAGAVVEPLADPTDWESALTGVPPSDGPAFVLADYDRAVLIRPRDHADVDRAVRAGDGGQRSAQWRSLDVVAAHRWLIADVLGVADTEENVGYAHSAEEARPPAAGSGLLALLLPATPAADVLAVAANGERMPRKSTLFMPKPASGVLMRAYDDRAGERP